MRAGIAMLHDKNVVVTGAGRGIGRALALAFAGQGATVVVHYGHSQREAEEVVRQIQIAGGRVLLAQADLSRPEEAYRLVAQAHAMLGPIDVWINNAGASANLAETRGLTDEERFERVMAVEVMGTWGVCRAVAEHMRHGGLLFYLCWEHALDRPPGPVTQFIDISKRALIS